MCATIYFKNWVKKCFWKYSTKVLTFTLHWMIVAFVWNVLVEVQPTSKRIVTAQVALRNFKLSFNVTANTAHDLVSDNQAGTSQIKSPNGTRIIIKGWLLIARKWNFQCKMYHSPFQKKIELQLQTQLLQPKNFFLRTNRFDLIWEHNRYRDHRNHRKRIVSMKNETNLEQYFSKPAPTSSEEVYLTFWGASFTTTWETFSRFLLDLTIDFTHAEKALENSTFTSFDVERKVTVVKDDMSLRTTNPSVKKFQNSREKKIVLSAFVHSTLLAHLQKF